MTTAPDGAGTLFLDAVAIQGRVSPLAIDRGPAGAKPLFACDARLASRTANHDHRPRRGGNVVFGRGGNPRAPSPWLLTAAPRGPSRCSRAMLAWPAGLRTMTAAPDGAGTLFLDAVAIQGRVRPWLLTAAPRGPTRCSRAMLAWPAGLRTMTTAPDGAGTLFLDAVAIQGRVRLAIDRGPAGAKPLFACDARLASRTANHDHRPRRGGNVVFGRGGNPGAGAPLAIDRGPAGAKPLFACDARLASRTANHDHRPRRGGNVVFGRGGNPGAGAPWLLTAAPRGPSRCSRAMLAWPAGLRTMTTAPDGAGTLFLDAVAIQGRVPPWLLTAAPRGPSRCSRAMLAWPAGLRTMTTAPDGAGTLFLDAVAIQGRVTLAIDRGPAGAKPLFACDARLASRTANHDHRPRRGGNVVFGRGGNPGAGAALAIDRGPAGAKPLFACDARLASRTANHDHRPRRGGNVVFGRGGNPGAVAPLAIDRGPAGAKPLFACDARLASRTANHDHRPRRGGNVVFGRGGNPGAGAPWLLTAAPRGPSRCSRAMLAWPAGLRTMTAAPDGAERCFWTRWQSRGGSPLAIDRGPAGAKPLFACDARLASRTANHDHRPRRGGNVVFGRGGNPGAGAPWLLTAAPRGPSRCSRAMLAWPAGLRTMTAAPDGAGTLFLDAVAIQGRVRPGY